MKILYFARLRQLAGRASEDVAVPASVKTIRELIVFLSARDEQVAAALADQRTLKVAIDKKHASLDASIAGASEIAFFPPVTGG
jgi:molybdopterin synthase sulfur carrier subunit